MVKIWAEWNVACDCILLDCWHIDCIVVEFFFLTEPVCIAEAIKKQCREARNRTPEKQAEGGH